MFWFDLIIFDPIHLLQLATLFKDSPQASELNLGWDSLGQLELNTKHYPACTTHRFFTTHTTWGSR